MADTTGTVLIAFWPDDYPFKPGDPIWCTRYPVIGWEVVDGGAEPITCEYIGSSSPWCLELRADGKPYSWVFLEDRGFDSFEEAKRPSLEAQACRRLLAVLPEPVTDGAVVAEATASARKANRNSHGGVPSAALADCGRGWAAIPMMTLSRRARRACIGGLINA